MISVTIPSAARSSAVAAHHRSDFVEDGTAFADSSGRLFAADTLPDNHLQ